MSHPVNDNLIERAYEVMEECHGSILGQQIYDMLRKKSPDLEHLYSVVAQAEEYLRYYETVSQ